MVSKSLKYTIEDFENIIFNGFDYEIQANVLEIITNLAREVGSPDYVKTPMFPKKEISLKSNSIINNNLQINKKRKGNKDMEVLNNEEWEALRNFQTTKIEKKSCCDIDIDLIRSLLNKLTDKNYIDISHKIIEIITKIVSENETIDLEKISSNIFDLASSNRYYSKIYAQLFSDLSNKFEFIKKVCIFNLNKFIHLFDVIEYIDPNQNYDKFCEINKINEKRKCLATFYINLMYLNVIPKIEIVKITHNLLSKIYKFINIDNKKNEVDELTETISLLYKKDIYEDDDEYDYEYNNIEGYTINEIVLIIANSKTKDFKSLTNKSLFKFMDLIDM
jgi:hypothetical protein